MECLYVRYNIHNICIYISYVRTFRVLPIFRTRVRDSPVHRLLRNYTYMSANMESGSNDFPMQESSTIESAERRNRETEFVVHLLRKKSDCILRDRAQ